MPALINEIESTELFVGTVQAPRQVVRVWLAQDDFQPYGGEIEVRPADGGGTCMSFTLPVEETPVHV